MAKPIVIGLTGNIATGKSTVSDILADLGAQTIDADKLVHQILSSDPSVQSKIADRFGVSVRKKDGTIDRGRLATVVFQNSAALRELEAIIHPYVERQVFNEIFKSEAPAVVVEAIKLLESNLAGLCQNIWVTTCREDQQIERMLTIRKMTREKAIARIRSQPPQIEKINRADVVIDTSGRLEDTRKQVQNAWRLLFPTQGDGPNSMAGVSIRRGTPRDAAGLAAFFNKVHYDRPPVDRAQILASYGDQGYMLAEKDRQIVAAASWNSENFIANIYQVIVHPYDREIGRALLEAVCQAATELMCEVALLFYPPDAPVQSRDLYLSNGFENTMLDDLIPAWKKSAQASMPENSLIMIRKLRDTRVMRPV